MSGRSPPSPFRSEADLARLRDLDPGDVPYVTEAVTSLVAELGATPLIGFAGGPFTLASYLIEGGPSKSHDRTRALMYGDPGLWHALLARLAGITAEFLRVQVSAGARRGSAVRLLGRGGRARRLPDGGAAAQQADLRGAGRLGRAPDPLRRRNRGAAPLLGEAGADVVGVDWRVGLDEAARRVDAGKALQGNLDPAILLAPWPVVEEQVKRVLAQGRVAEGHVFNLGHGVLPETDPDVLARVTDLVHQSSGAAAE